MIDHLMNHMSKEVLTIDCDHVSNGTDKMGIEELLVHFVVKSILIQYQAF